VSKEKQVQRAPYTHWNWGAFKPGVRPKNSSEWVLFSDAWFAGHLRELGPYSVLNLFKPHRRRGPWRQAYAALVLRIGHYPDVDDAGNWGIHHGGSHAEEFAALLSLCAGIRVKAGGWTRWFTEGGDPMGMPMGFARQIDYEVPESGWEQLPRAVAVGPNCHIPLEEGGYSQRLRTFPSLDGKDADVLVTAARLYQDALWIAEPQPHLAWLFFVSAIETIANRGQRKDRHYVDRLNKFDPELVEILRAKGKEHLEVVAKRLSRFTAIGDRFMDFILQFNPGPLPGKRPLAVDWDNLREPLRLVYKWRSKALHEGTPFPAPMCWHPHQIPLVDTRYDKGALPERPPVELLPDSRWPAEEMPMLLHVFEHITRGCLLKWWESRVPSAKDT
jgi:hypothetical protein